VTQRLAAAQTPRGELVLRQRGELLELISNGTFLMDTSNGESERAMATLALDGMAGRPRVLIGGMGFGFTLAATLSHDVAEAVVVEVEPDVIAWNEQWWPAGRAALRDPRVHVVIDDLARYVRSMDAPFDAVLVDIDNGPDWTVAEANNSLYDELLPDLRRAVRAPGGRLCVWSAAASASFAARLAAHFTDIVVREVPVPRGDPDVLYLATA
jgi:spermidine synthase